MDPAKVLVQPPIISSFLPPDNKDITPLEDWQLGGIGLSDPSAGLQYQNWHLFITGTTLTTAVWVEADNTAPVQIFAKPDITWARLAFDQNMRPVISFVWQDGPAFYWWDPTVPGNTFTALAATVLNPCVTLDDKRPQATQTGSSDVVMAYVDSNTLYYRLQRDRYAVQYQWMDHLELLLANPFVNKIGMGTGLRLMIELRGSLYL